jgi:hypothetical protein
MGALGDELREGPRRVDDESRQKIKDGYGWDPWEYLRPEDFAVEQALDALDAGAPFSEVEQSLSSGLRGS